MKLTTQDAEAVIAAAVAKAADIKVPMNIAVLDAGSHIPLRVGNEVFGAVGVSGGDRMLDGKIVKAFAFFDSIEFNDYWKRVTPAARPWIVRDLRNLRGYRRDRG